MRIFNRLVMVIVLAGLFLGGLFAVIYSLGVLGYQMSDLQRQVDLPGYYQSLQSFVDGVEQSNLTPAGVAILIVVALVGLILLILELKPRRPRRVRMQKGTYITRGVVSDEVSQAAEKTSNVLGSSVKVRAKRRPGAVVRIQADTRRGGDQREVRNALKDSVQQGLAHSGVPLGKLKIQLSESDPRETNTRVQ